MFKFKIAVLYVVLIALSFGVPLFVVGEQKERARAEAVAQVKRARLHLERDMRLRELELQNAAREIAGGRVSAYLETLKEFRNQLVRLEKDLETIALEDRETFVRQKSGFVDSFLEALLRRYDRIFPEKTWVGTSRERFESKLRGMLVKCAANSFAQCAFRFSYTPLKAEMSRFNQRFEKDRSSRARIDLALIVDDHGFGIADAKDPMWSDKEDFAKKNPVFDAALDADSAARDIMYREGGSHGYHVVVAVPIRAGESVLGTLIVGTELGKNLAELTADEFGLGVTYLHGDDVFQSTLLQGEEGELLGLLGDGAAAPFEFATDARVAATFPYLGNTSDNEVRVVLSRDFDSVHGELNVIQTVLVVVAVVLILLGLAIGQYVLAGYVEPFVELDAGIHEVIAGDPDYQFSFDVPDKLASDMAQSLNLMVAVLRGRPLPEEEVGEDWDERLLIDEELFDEGVTDEALGQMAPAARAAGSERGRELLTESAEAYYRRVHAEFVAGRRQLGKSVAGVTYVRFVEKLARRERELKERLSCRFVRFEVTIREGQVMLTPIPIP